MKPSPLGSPRPPTRTRVLGSAFGALVGALCLVCIGSLSWVEHRVARFCDEAPAVGAPVDPLALATRARAQGFDGYFSAHGAERIEQLRAALDRLAPRARSISVLPSLDSTDGERLTVMGHWLFLHHSCSVEYERGLVTKKFLRSTG